MLKYSNLTGFSLAAVLFGTLAAASAFADERPTDRTSGSSISVEARSAARLRSNVIEGRIVSFGRQGFYLDTVEGRMPIYAPRNARVLYRGERIRFNDLRDGDRVSVVLGREYRAGYRADEITLIGSDRGGVRQEIRETQFDDIRGRVLSINRRVSTFAIRTSDGREITVDALHARPPRGERGRNPYEWLTVGDYVRLTGEMERGGVFRVDSIFIDGTRGDRGIDRYRDDRDDRDDDRRRMRTEDEEDEDEDDDEEEDDEEED